MPIIANNMIVGSKPVEEVKETKLKSFAPQPPVAPLASHENKPIVPKMQYNKEEHGIVIVDGKEKKISKHSAYILDMLSLDND